MNKVEGEYGNADDENHGSNGDDAVEAVKHSSVAGEDEAVVLDAVIEFEKGEDKVTDLGNQCDEKTQNGEYMIGGKHTACQIFINQPAVK